MQNKAWLKFLSTTIVLLILVGVCLILFVIVWSEAGRWYGFVAGKFGPAPGSDHLVFYYIRFEGRTEPKWHLTCPNNFRYTHLSLQVDTDSGTKRAEVDVPSMQYRTEGDFASLSTETLLAWIGAPQDDQHLSMLKRELNWLVHLMRSAGTGELPRTRHHPYFYKSPAWGHLTHFSLGGGAAVAMLFGFLCIALGVGFRLLLRPRMAKPA
jgi:hypothetical protein